MRKTIALLALCVLSSLGMAQQPGGSVHGPAAKAPWQFTDAERIAVRSAPAREGGRIQGQGVPSGSGDKRGYREAIDGRLNPELLLPYELFDRLVGGLSQDKAHQEHVRRTVEPGIRALGYDVDQFWTRLDSVARTYVWVQEKHAHRGQPTHFTSSTGESITVLVDPEVCSARIAALQDARHLLGATEFDRLLYTVVAPQVRFSVSGTAPERGEQLRFVAGGCK